jgi:squalene synthase HpnC
MTTENISLTEAYNYCRMVALGHYENFPVGSLLIPRDLRKHFFALYAFMRAADDFADLPDREKEKRIELLADWWKQLDESLSGVRVHNPVFIALCNTIAERKLPKEPFYRLLEAFEFDAKGNVHFRTFDELRWYTSRSAEPVGELVLALFGYRDTTRIKLSNEICTALQLLNFIQDIREDTTNKRYYYPEEDWRIFNTTMKSGSINHDRLALSSLFEVDRIESLIDKGAPLAESVRGRLRYELRAVIRSARKMIAKIRKLDGNTYTKRPKLSKFDTIIILLQSLILKVY